MHLEHDWFSKSLPENVRLGERSWLYSSFAFLHFQSTTKRAVCVGNDSGLYHGTFFDLGPDAEVIIGDYCAVVGAVFVTNGRITIGDYTFIAHEVVIADCDWTLPGGGPSEPSSHISESQANAEVEIGRNVWIGAQSTIIGSVRIGEGAIIGAGSLVRTDVPPYTVCAGNPLRIVRLLKNSNPSGYE
jgi:acetyltransferase-like isoleucine patch superfamily enzyme